MMRLVFYPPAAVSRATGSVNRVFQRFTSTETRNFRRCDGDFLASLWVAAGAGSTFTNSKSTKANQRNFIPCLQRFGNGINQSI